MKIFNLKNRIILGIYAMYLARKLKSPFVPESLVLVILGGIISFSISVPSVLSNMFSAGDFYQYFVVAFSNTELMVQMLLVLALIPAIFFIKDIATLAQTVRARLS